MRSTPHTEGTAEQRRAAFDLVDTGSIEDRIQVPELTFSRDERRVVDGHQTTVETGSSLAASLNLPKRAPRNAPVIFERHHPELACRCGVRCRWPRCLRQGHRAGAAAQGRRLSPAHSYPRAFVRAHEEVLGLGLHPRHKGLELGMLQQGLHGGLLACQLAFCEQRMNLAVTDAMQELRPTPAFALGNQMMAVGLRRRDHAVA